MRESKILQVKALVEQRGGFSAVYSAYPALYEAYQRGDRQGPCPKTGAGKTKFRFRQDGSAYHNDVGNLGDYIEVLAWYEGKAKADILDDIIRVCGGDISCVSKRDLQALKNVQQQVRENPITPEESARRRKSVQSVWKGVSNIVGTPVETYLRSRGIKGDLSVLDNLRFHPALYYKESQDSPSLKLPAMCAVVRNAEGKPLTLHRTFLNNDGTGKADVLKQKMMMKQPSSLTGAYIQIDQPIDGPHGKIIGITEGIENALSIREATGCPMWVGISDRIMEKVAFPDDVTHIIVFADLEPSGAGMRAAEALRSIWEPKGKHVSIEAPTMYDRDKIDWNDVYVEFGATGFSISLSSEYRVYTGVEVPE
jgi:putative DNA primase/helicase